MWLTDVENRSNTFAKRILKAEVLFHTLKNQVKLASPIIDQINLQHFYTADSYVDL